MAYRVNWKTGAHARINCAISSSKNTERYNYRF